MKVRFMIKAGICGFETEVSASCADIKQSTKIDVESNCEKINKLGELYQGSPVITMSKQD